MKETPQNTVDMDSATRDDAYFEAVNGRSKMIAAQASEKQYVPGVYLLKQRDGDGDSPVIYFNGTTWWLPGWECGMTIGETKGSFTIPGELIGELIWEDRQREDAVNG